jgi:hypothetical protein
MAAPTMVAGSTACAGIGLAATTTAAVMAAIAVVADRPPNRRNFI